MHGQVQWKLQHHRTLTFHCLLKSHFSHMPGKVAFLRMFQHRVKEVLLHFGVSSPGHSFSKMYRNDYISIV